MPIVYPPHSAAGSPSRRRSSRVARTCGSCAVRRPRPCPSSSHIHRDIPRLRAPAHPAHRDAVLAPRTSSAPSTRCSPPSARLSRSSLRKRSCTRSRWSSSEDGIDDRVVDFSEEAGAGSDEEAAPPRITVSDDSDSDVGEQCMGPTQHISTQHWRHGRPPPWLHAWCVLSSPPISGATNCAIDNAGSPHPPNLACVDLGLNPAAISVRLHLTPSSRTLTLAEKNSMSLLEARRLALLVQLHVLHFTQQPWFVRTEFPPGAVLVLERLHHTLAQITFCGHQDSWLRVEDHLAHLEPIRDLRSPASLLPPLLFHPAPPAASPSATCTRSGLPVPVPVPTPPTELDQISAALRSVRGVPLSSSLPPRLFPLPPSDPALTALPLLTLWLKAPETVDVREWSDAARGRGAGYFALLLGDTLVLASALFLGRVLLLLVPRRRKRPPEEEGEVEVEFETEAADVEVECEAEEHAAEGGRSTDTRVTRPLGYSV
ncbi:hypothetical protein B0H13DRAFT_2342839 [Mycena leptocephala]|nr:hypothetical protein B0H13DRAFT_2342839 [Mycena leptocephala]